MLVAIALIAAVRAADPSPSSVAESEERLDALLPAGNVGSVSPTWAVEEFRAARAALGRSFEHDLLPRVLGSSVERHYWVATFLAEDAYLRGDPPDLRLAVAVLEAGLAHLWAVRDDEERVHLETKVSYLAALYAHELGDDLRACAHKARFQMLVATAPKVATASIPAVDDDERAAFAAIRGVPHR